MMRYIGAIVALMLLSGTASAATPTFVEGRHYERVIPAVPVSTPAGVSEVVEVFSYGCIACSRALPMVTLLKTRLPKNARLVYVPASFNPSEGWPMFQRAYLTAQVMGIADKTHEALFDAIWTTGEFPLIDKAAGRYRQPLPSIEDAAKFYAKHAGIKAADFIANSKSFAVETKVGQAEQLVRDYQAESTPTFIVNGKYRLIPGVGTYEEMQQAILFLLTQ